MSFCAWGNQTKTTNTIQLDNRPSYCTFIIYILHPSHRSLISENNFFFSTYFGRVWYFWIPLYTYPYIWLEIVVSSFTYLGFYFTEKDIFICEHSFYALFTIYYRSCMSSRTAQIRNFFFFFWGGGGWSFLNLYDL